MNARYYVPGISKFASADTIVPDPANPQSYNRYSYSYNNPSNLVDPSGHCAGDPDNNNPFNDDGTIVYDCTVDNFESMSIEVRFSWIQQFMAQGDKRKTKNWFNNIQGIIQGFALFDLSQPGTWLSHVDAVILHSIQDGYRMSRRGYQRDEGSWGFAGANAWKTFFDKLYSGAITSELISSWGTAEQTATNYGEGYAYARGTSPNRYEQFFLDTGNLYRQAASAGGLGNNVESLMVDNGIEWEVLLNAGNQAGNFFNDPRSLIGGYAPVYWYSQMIWSTQNWVSGPYIWPNWEYSHFAGD